MLLRVSAVFSSLLSLKYITYSFFCLSALSLFPPCCRLSLLSSVPPPLPQARGHPCPSLLPSACPPDACSCCVFRGCRVSSGGCRALCPSPSLPLSPSGAPPKLPGGLLCALPCVLLLPSLVRHQAQDGVTVWADAPRVCPRPFVLLPMCCRVFRCPFCGLPCCLLPVVPWWQ